MRLRRMEFLLCLKTGRRRLTDDFPSRVSWAFSHAVNLSSRSYEVSPALFVRLVVPSSCDRTNEQFVVNRNRSRYQCEPCAFRSCAPGRTHRTENLGCRNNTRRHVSL